jgi:hypothetical protein
MRWPSAGDMPVTAIPLVSLAGTPAQDKSKRFRRVVNHRGESPERPIRISLPPHTYVVRARTSRSERPKFFIAIKAGQTSKLYVELPFRRPS